MSYQGVFQVKNRILSQFQNVGLKLEDYSVESKRKGEEEILNIYSGQRGSFLGIKYGGNLVAQVRVVAHASETYRNGPVTSVTSDIPEISAENLRAAAEGKLAPRVNGSNGTH